MAEESSDSAVRGAGLADWLRKEYQLGPRAAQVAALLADGCTSDKEIALQLRISRSRAHEHVQALLGKWSLHNRAKLAVELAVLAAARRSSAA